MRSDIPKDNQSVLIKIRCRNRRTSGMVIWEELTIPAVYCSVPYPSESGHFHGNFGVSDSECFFDEVEILDWVGF